MDDTNWEVMLDALAVWVLSKVPSLNADWIGRKFGLTRDQTKNYLGIVEGLDYHDRQRLIGGNNTIHPTYVGGMDDIAHISDMKGGRRG
jgi:hypothetical protein